LGIGFVFIPDTYRLTADCYREIVTSKSTKWKPRIQTNTAPKIKPSDRSSGETQNEAGMIVLHQKRKG
jgi:hypothetical protein